jgi:hypothetical protein
MADWMDILNSDDGNADYDRMKRESERQRGDEPDRTRNSPVKLNTGAPG